MHALLRQAGRVGLATAATGAVCVAYGALYEVRAYRLRRFDVPVLPAGSRPLRLLHVSDLHLTPDRRRLVEWTRGLATLEPDLVINTGDNIAHVNAVDTATEALGPLLELPGAFVFGSNDYYAPVKKNPLKYFRRRRGPIPLTAPPLPTEQLRSELTGAGWRDLSNARDTLAVDGRRVLLSGVDDPHIGFDRYAPLNGTALNDPTFNGTVEEGGHDSAGHDSAAHDSAAHDSAAHDSGPHNHAATASPTAGTNATEPHTSAVDLRVGIAHAPYRRVLDAMSADGHQLLLAGHTHGGQVCLPFVGALVTNCDLDAGRTKGLSRYGASWLHVSAGLGTSPYAPYRFACYPEASLLTLRATDAPTT